MMSTPYDDKTTELKEDEISPADILSDLPVATDGNVTQDMRNKILGYYGHNGEEDKLAPREDISKILDFIIATPEDDALDILVQAIEYHRDDPNFPTMTMDNIKRLVRGYKNADMAEAEWSFELRTQACIIHYHSPYPEVRSVTDPFDDPTIHVETLRAYFLGMCFMAGATALNTFFSPRQPAISIGGNVLQLLLAPAGIFLAKILPDWGFSLFGHRYSLNPGPWTYKEQVFATICFTVASGPGATYYVYLVQRLPQYLGQRWVTFGYEITLALATQTFGLGFAGLLRRFVVFPVTQIWPKVLPTLALNRALLIPEQRERINGWTITRYRFFMTAFAAMFVWFWIPNSLFTALRLFNWMTWIAPNNFTLATVTGSYGGMGFNPWATFDWNVSGTGHLVTPFFSALQQYGARVLSGLLAIILYYKNVYWSAYTPLNSNEAFDNTGKVYNVTRILGGDGLIDIQKYKEYGPPYVGAVMVFGQGAWFAWYPMTLFYVSIRNWGTLSRSFKEMYQSVRYRKSVWEGNNDAHSRMMKVYPEVADWWFAVILLIAFALGVTAVTAWPTHTPWWSLLTVIGLSAVFIIPSAILVATANVNMGFNVLFQLLAGVWFAGNPMAQVIVVAFGQNFNAQADNYISDQKLAHYAKLPPRAIFRAQISAVVLNCFIFVGMLNWMVTSYDDGTLCTWSNKEHFVCTDAVLVFASAIEYGTFGVRNFLRLYPILPWTFLMGTVVGVTWAMVQKYGPRWREHARLTWNERRYLAWDKWLFQPTSYLGWVDPTVTWAGSLTWSGGNNLTYATNGLYVSFIFMYYIKNRYGSWWEKYNYLLEAGFDIGVAISGIIQSFAFNFTGASITWWGNTVATAGLDFQAYNQNSTLLPLPEKGYFGLEPEDYPMSW